MCQSPPDITDLLGKEGSKLIAFAGQRAFHWESDLGGLQWWSVTKYNYFVTVLKYIFQVSVIYWSRFYFE